MPPIIRRSIFQDDEGEFYLFDKPSGVTLRWRFLVFEPKDAGK